MRRHTNSETAPRAMAVTATTVVALVALIVAGDMTTRGRAGIRPHPAEVAAVLADLPTARAVAAVVAAARDLLGTSGGRDLLTPAPFLDAPDAIVVATTRRYAEVGTRGHPRPPAILQRLALPPPARG